MMVRFLSESSFLHLKEAKESRDVLRCMLRQREAMSVARDVLRQRGLKEAKAKESSRQKMQKSVS